MNFTGKYYIQVKKTYLQNSNLHKPVLSTETKH